MFVFPRCAWPRAFWCGSPPRPQQRDKHTLALYSVSCLFLAYPVVRMRRREAWLAAASPDDEGGDGSQEQPAAAQPRGTIDKYVIDLDIFKFKTGSSRKPRDFNTALKIADWLHIDETV